MAPADAVPDQTDAVLAVPCRILGEQLLAARMAAGVRAAAGASAP